MEWAVLIFLRGLGGWDMLIGGPGADELHGGESGAKDAVEEDRLLVL